jgi:hypothetical protein
VLHGRGGVLFFIAGGGGWKRVAQVAAGGSGIGETGGAAEQWQPQSKRGRHRRCRYSDNVADERGPHSFLFSLNYPNRLKLEN